jgi:hypothetical protein
MSIPAVVRVVRVSRIGRVAATGRVGPVVRTVEWFADERARRKDVAAAAARRQHAEKRKDEERSHGPCPEVPPGNYARKTARAWNFNVV